MKIADLFKVEGYGVVVTGGASGLGLGFTEALAANGARVTMLDIDPKRIAAETARLRELGYDVRGAVVDVSDHAALDGPSTKPPRRTAGSTWCSPMPASIPARASWRVGGCGATAQSGGRPRELHGRALESRHRRQPERRVRHAARRGAPHEAAQDWPHHRHDFARRAEERGRGRRGATWRRRRAPRISCATWRSSWPPTTSR